MKIHRILLYFAMAAFGLASVSAKPEKKSASKLTVIGEIESVSFLEKKLQLDARIDTGATTSSLSAKNIEIYERDGKKWVRFDMPTVKDPKGKWVKVERKLTRIVPIKRHGAEPLNRPVVSMLVAIGDIKCRCEFSLTDRSAYEFPVLIGRNFLSGRALVDVSRSRVAHPLSKEESNEN